jgi:hypothetical protein
VSASSFGSRDGGLERRGRIGDRGGSRPRPLDSPRINVPRDIADPSESFRRPPRRQRGHVTLLLDTEDRCD